MKGQVVTEAEKGSGEFAPRLDMIETEWTMFRNAHAGTTASGEAARNQLVLRYASAIRDYVRALTKNDTDADELSQDVIMRFLNGDFGGADPNRGRFRDLLKVAVRNMTRSWWAKENRRKGVDYDLALEADTEQPDELDQDWAASWRKNILDIAWSRLEAFQDARPDSILHTVMSLRVESPDADSTELAELASEECEREITAATFRQNLRRARVRFAEFVVEEVANGMDSVLPDRIQEELIAVGLFEQIRDVLPDSWTTGE